MKKSLLLLAIFSLVVFFSTIGYCQEKFSMENGDFNYLR